ncbi:P-type conjugative transfer protein TrbL [Massilia glaciei]|uniref:P-type conjugative transfer protein TrbL n=2 Tax=Massilia glaciei TaxID=1524097 RepID=A0A2U2I6K8_9BURK|nr:P-type conjugative transfer protein TrbL [Massilia glaciei]
MPVSKITRISWLLFLWLAIFSVRAYAAGPGATSNDILDNVLQRYSNVASNWGTLITTRATWLFWLLSIISMIWTFGFMALRKADLGELFSEFIRFTIFTGFFWWLLLNGPRFATDIMMSLRMIAAQASGLPSVLAPSGIVDIGFDIFYKVVDISTVWQPMESLFGMLLSMAILIVFALIGVNMLLLLVSGWIFAYAGVFILGFGGSRWTSEMAIGYFKSILNIGLQLMTMILLVGVGKSFVDQYYASMSAGMPLKELAVMAVVAAVLLALVAKVPPQIGALAGGTTGNMGSNFGVGAAVAAAAMGAAAVASTGAALAAGASGAAGGAQALMAAFSKASAAESAGGGTSAVMGSAGGAGGDTGGGFGGGAGAGGGGGGGSSALAAAMGDTSGGGAGSVGADPGSSATAGSSSAAGSWEPGSGSGTGSGAGSGSGSGSGSGAGGKGGAGKPTAGGGGSPGEVKPSRPLAAAGAMAAKAARIAAGTAVNLAQGSYDVAKGRTIELKDDFLERIADTTGGQIASAINARKDAVDAGGKSATFAENSLAAGTRSAEAEAEIAAFRDGKN